MLAQKPYKTVIKCKKAQSGVKQERRATGNNGGGGGGDMLNYKLYCFVTNFTTISRSSEFTKGRELKYTFSDTSLHNQSKNECFKCMTVEVLKYSAPKFRTSRCYANSLKMNVFFHLSVGLSKILSMWL